MALQIVVLAVNTVSIAISITALVQSHRAIRRSRALLEQIKARGTATAARHRAEG